MDLTTTSKKVETRNLRFPPTQNLTQHTTQEDRTDRQVYGVAPEPGWTIDPSNPAFIEDGPQGHPHGDWSQRLKTLSPTLLEYEVATTGRPGPNDGDSGWIEFHIAYTVAHTTDITQTATQPVELSWGQEKSIPAPPNG